MTVPDWSQPLLQLSASMREFMLKYRAPDEDMDERALTVHLAHEMGQFEKAAAYPGLQLRHDIKMKEAGRESVHGADLEVWFRGGGLDVGFRLQAKRLIPRPSDVGTYKHLPHMVARNDGPDVRQVDLLLGKTPPRLRPGYIFYNAPEASVSACATACCHPVAPEDRFGLPGYGLTVAPAHAIAARWGSTTFNDINALAVPAVCMASCSTGNLFLSRLWPMVLGWPRYINLQPGSYLPLSAAIAWRRMDGDALLLAASSDVADGVRRFAADVVGLDALQVEVGQAPNYVLQLASEGTVGDLQDSDRPADLVAVLTATGRPLQPEPQR